MTHLVENDWYFSSELHNESVRGQWGGFCATELIETSMSLLSMHVRDGSVHKAASQVFRQLPSSRSSSADYGESELDEYFGEGKFLYGSNKDAKRDTAKFIQLELRGICPACASAAGAASLDEPWIEIHWEQYISLAQREPELYPQNQVGLRRLAIEMSGVLLHEVMHNHGFEHPVVGEQFFHFDPFSEYYQSLPCVAQQAMYIVADDYFSESEWIPSQSKHWPAACGCVAKTAPNPKRPSGGSEASLELPEIARPSNTQVRPRH